jgi:hypothetical protein
MADREGPKVTVERSCFGCRYEHSESYQAQGDSGSSVSCVHPTVGKKRIGDSTWVTPAWCPFLAPKPGLPFPPEVVERAYRLHFDAIRERVPLEKQVDEVLTVLADYLRALQQRVTELEAERDGWRKSREERNDEANRIQRALNLCADERDAAKRVLALRLDGHSELQALYASFSPHHVANPDEATQYVSKLRAELEAAKRELERNK